MIPLTEGQSEVSYLGWNKLTMCEVLDLLGCIETGIIKKDGVSLIKFVQEKVLETDGSIKHWLGIAMFVRSDRKGQCRLTRSFIEIGNLWQV